MEGFHDIPAMLELQEHSSVDGAGFKLLDVVEGDIHEKKALFTIYTSADPEPHQSKCIISEIEDDTSSLSDASYSPIDDHEESDAMMSEEEEPSAHMTTPAPAPKNRRKLLKMSLKLDAVPEFQSCVMVSKVRLLLTRPRPT
jgi:hypothetical protein